MDYRRLRLNYKYNLPELIPKEDVFYETKICITDEEEIAYYLGQVRKILQTGPCHGTTTQPVELIAGLYIGTASQAENLELLEKLGISHVLNCAGMPSRRVQRQERYVAQEYEEITPANGETVDIDYYFQKAHTFIDRARNVGGRVLVYCPDVDRSGAVAMAYLIKRGTPLLDAAKLLKDRRKVGIFNQGFIKQLVLYARDKGALRLTKPHLDLPNYSLARVRDRPATSHLLTFL